MATLKDMSTWTDRLGSSKLRTFRDEQGHFWLEQNPDKRSKWVKLARDGHHVAWEFERPGGTYTGRMLIDGEVYTPSEATKKFLWVPSLPSLSPIKWLVTADGTRTFLSGIVSPWSVLPKQQSTPKEPLIAMNPFRDGDTTRRSGTLSRPSLRKSKASMSTCSKPHPRSWRNTSREKRYWSRSCCTSMTDISRTRRGLTLM
jgi:hypothetical protein